ncbi:TIR domain-containing protein [Bradyrhizobium erythrophlei]|uniref:WD40 repeat n=1 Tax=Bradyrhizobium erythrophlei TaxID=1437360 RepID=A0A1M5Y945_9BRAD|nr:TIR domain-containing protein [Bradyrhizobium erythrophlei]SHI08033.1 WD40 repeat [Bradyrhizobium erythrophlei]
MRIFVSFASKDRECVRRFVAGLCARKPDASLFFDERDLHGGVYWIPKLGQELRKADVVILILGSRIGPWQELEYYEALQLSRQTEGRPRIIPIIITDSPAPGLAFLSTIQHIFAVDLTSRNAIDAVDRALSDVRHETTLEPWKQFQPYKGLPALTSTDAAFFFGREKETAEILDLLARARGRLITLIGQSGVGKSSLVMAGVMSRLKSQLWPLDRGTWPLGLKESRSFLQFTIHPGSDPLKELAVSLVRLYKSDDLAETDRDASAWVTRFREGARLQDMLRLVREKIADAQGGYAPKRFVLYVDQGEELYTRTKRKEDAQLFSELLAGAASDDDSFSVLLSLRSDFYSNFQNDQAIFTLSTVFNVLPLGQDGLVDAIRKPAELLGVRFEDAKMPLVIAEGTRDPGALPLLSDLLQEMWLNMLSRADGVLRWADQPGIVDIGLPLRRRADAFLQMTSTNTEIVRRLFTLRLAQVSQVGSPVRRRATKSECLSEEWAVAEELAGPEQRLLTIATPFVSAEPFVEVAHEQLLRSWPTLKAWLDDQREFLIWRTETENAAKAYGRLAEAEKPEALLMGLPLRRAETWFEQRSADLAQDVRDFVKASIEHHRDIVETAAKRETERLAIEVKLGEAELDRERLARLEAERAREIETLRAKTAEDRQAADEVRREAERREEERRLRDAETIAIANRRVARFTGLGLFVSLALATGLAWFAYSARVSRNETALAFRIATTLAEGDTPAAAGLALRAFHSASTLASRAALFEAAIEISPHLERRVHLDTAVRALEWVDSQTLAIAEDTGNLYIVGTSQQPALKKVPLQKSAAKGEENYTSVLQMKALASGLLVVVLNNGYINVIGKEQEVLATYQIKLSDDYASNARIEDAGQDTFIISFVEADRFRPVRCQVNPGPRSIFCKAVISLPLAGVTSAASDAQGERFYVAQQKVLSNGEEATALIGFDQQGHSLLTPLSFAGVIQNLSLSYDGRTLAFTLQDSVQFFDVDSKEVRSIGDFAGRRGVAALPSNTWRPARSELPLLCDDYTICICRKDRSSVGELAEEFRGHRAPITHLSWDPTGERLASRDANNELLIWSFRQSGEVYRDLVTATEKQIWTTAAVSPQRDMLAFIPGLGNQVGLLSINGGEERQPNYVSTDGPAEAVVITPERLYVALPEKIHSRRRSSDEPFRAIETGSASILVWAGKADDILMATPDRITITDSSATLEFAKPPQGDGLFGLTVDRKRRLALASYRDGPVVAFDLTTRKPVAVLPAAKLAGKPREGSASLSVDEASGLLAVSGNGNFVDIYDLNRFANYTRLTAQVGETVSVAFSPTGSKLAALDALGGLTIWEFEQGNAHLSLATRALPLARMRPIRAGKAQPPTMIFWSDDTHILICGGTGHPEVVSTNASEWARRITSLGYGSTKDIH